MNYLQSREQKWYRVSTAFLLTSRRTEIAPSTWEPKLQGLLAEDVMVQVVPRAEHSGDFIMRITKSSVKDVNLDIIIGALWWYKTWRNTVVTILPVQNKNFSGDPEEPNEVPGADEEAKSHLRGRNLERRHLGRRH